MQKDVVYINYFDGIDMNRARLLMDACTKIIAQFQPKTLYFLFASPGGDVTSGIALYNFLKALPQKIVMHNMSSVDSIGTVIFLAGDERYACPNTTFLFHGVETQVRKDSSFPLNKLREIASSLSKDQEKIAGIIAENTDISKEEVERFFASGESKDLSFAQSKKFIHGIRSASIGKDDILFNVAFQQQT